MILLKLSLFSIANGIMDKYYLVMVKKERFINVLTLKYFIKYTNMGIPNIYILPVCKIIVFG